MSYKTPKKSLKSNQIYSVDTASYTYLRVVPGSVAVYDDLSVPPVYVDIVPYVDVMDSLHLPVWMPPVSVSTSVPPNCSSLCRILKSPRVSCTSSAVSDLCTTRDTCYT